MKGGSAKYFRGDFDIFYFSLYYVGKYVTFIFLQK